MTAARERYEWAKQEIGQEIDHPEFRQFFAVHETEARLLSQPDLFPAEVSDVFPGKVSQPETVNFTEPPAKLLDRLYRSKLRRTYKKVTHGKELFDRLDPETAYSKCPMLRELLDEMLRLASGASA